VTLFCRPVERRFMHAGYNLQANVKAMHAD
jgi:hypothetical protein